MAINVSVQYNGGLLPDIILLTQGYYHRGTRLNAIYLVEVLSLQPIKQYIITTLYRRYFQHAYFISIVGVGKRGEY